MALSKIERRRRIHYRIRKHVNGTAERPRLVVFRSNRQIYVQVINDETATTLVAAASNDKVLAAECKGKSGKEAAAIVGKAIAARAIEKGINEVAFDLMQVVNGHEKMRMVFGTGKWYYDSIVKKAEERGVVLKDNILIKDYIDDMENYLAASDLIISRAGALSVAETTVCGRACILIPSPNVTGNHQYYNAKAVADRGGAILIEEKDLTSEGLIKEVMHLKNNPEIAEKMGRAARACAPMKALDIIYDEIQAAL